MLVVTRKLFWGTSAFSGSDKQTLHTACTKHHGDDFTKMAQALGGGGAMDADMAYVEAVGSIDAFAGLKFLGLPLPQDRYGAVLRYQTDHDDFGRATSCGAAHLEVDGQGPGRRSDSPGHSLSWTIAPPCRCSRVARAMKKRRAGLLILNRTNHDNTYGLSVVLSPNVVSGQWVGRVSCTGTAFIQRTASARWGWRLKPAWN